MPPALTENQWPPDALPLQVTVCMYVCTLTTVKDTDWRCHMVHVTQGAKMQKSRRASEN